MKDNAFPVFFLAANSGDGFIYRFRENYDPANGWHAYIIKGGPGTGKSSFMRKCAVSAAQRGAQVILCPCSSDPDSLDGVILPKEKKIILDGTAPHVVEPLYPALCEQIVNTGEYWNADKLKGSEKELISLFGKHSLIHKRAAQYINAAGQLAKYNLSAALNVTDIDKVMKFATGLSKKNIPYRKHGNGREWVRFLGGITPKGPVFYGKTINSMCDNIFVIADSYGAVSSIILSVVRDYAIMNGYEIITVKNPLLPNDITDHIIIPELKIAFCRETDDMPIITDTRRIHARRFMNMADLHKKRQRIIFNKRVCRELLDTAAQTLSEAKSLHDVIEQFYINIMDFDALNSFAKDFAEKF